MNTFRKCANYLEIDLGKNESLSTRDEIRLAFKDIISVIDINVSDDQLKEIFQEAIDATNKY